MLWPRTSARTLLMVFGAWALLTRVSHLLAARRANVEGDDRGFVTAIGGAMVAVDLVLLIWPGTRVVAISWVIALAALLFVGLLIFLSQRLKRR